MTYLVKFPLEDGGSVVIEVDEPAQGTVPAAGPGEVAATASQTFEAALERIKPAATHIIQKLRGLADAPDEVEVEFGVKLSGKAGVVIASASADANYRVTMKWRRRQAQDDEAA